MHTYTLYQGKQMGKTRVNLTIEEKIVKKAKERGLNIFKIAENALTHIIERIEDSNLQNNIHNQNKESRGNVVSRKMVDRTGFEPVASAMPTRRSFQTDLPAQYDKSWSILTL